MIFRPVFVTTVQTNLHKDFIMYLKSIEKQRSMIRIVEQCSNEGSNGRYNRSIICHGNKTYNYVDILAVSICFILKKNVIIMDNVDFDCMVKIQCL